MMAKEEITRFHNKNKLPKKREFCTKTCDNESERALKND